MVERCRRERLIDVEVQDVRADLLQVVVQQERGRFAADGQETGGAGALDGGAVCVVVHAANAEFAGELVVDLEPGGTFVGARTAEGSDGVIDQTGEFGRGQERQHLGRDGTEAVRGDAVVGEWSPGGGVVDELRAEFAEIAFGHVGGGEGIEPAERAATAIELVEGEEPESLILAVIDFRDDERAAEGAAPFVLFGWSADGGEEAASVELFVAEKFKGGAVELVGAGLHGEAGDAAHGVGVFGGVVVGDEFEFADGVDGGVDLGVVGEISAAEGDTVIVDLILEAAAAGDGLCPGAGGGDAGGEADEAGGVADAAAEGEGHVEELLGFDDHADVGRFGLDEGDTALDGDAFSDGADGKADVDGGGLVGLNLDAALDAGAEPVGFGGDVVDARG